MTEAEKMAEECWLETGVAYYDNPKPTMKNTEDAKAVLARWIREIAERTREEYPHEWENKEVAESHS